jgi:hypothetical protein
VKWLYNNIAARAKTKLGSINNIEAEFDTTELHLKCIHSSVIVGCINEIIVVYFVSQSVMIKKLPDDLCLIFTTMGAM